MLTRHLFYEILVLIVLCILFFVVPLGADDYIIWTCLAVFYYYFIQCFKDPISIVPGITTYFKLDLLFMLFYYLLLYYPYQTYVLGSDSITKNTWVSKSYFEYSNIAIVASTISLNAFMIGFRQKIKLPNSYRIKEYSSRQLNLLFLVIISLTTLFFILFYLKGGMVMLSGAYLGSRTKDAAIDGLYTLLSVFVSVCAGYCVIYYKKRNKINIYTAIVAFLFAIYGYLTLVGGDRNTFFIVAIALAGAYYTYIRSISKKLLITFVILALGLYQVIEISRMAEERSLGAIIQVITGESEVRVATELGGNVDEGSFSITNLVTRAAFHFVPERDDHSLGKYLVIGFAGFIPYARGAIIDPRDPYQSSAFYITRVNGSGFGLGSSIVMDSYIEFGLIGLIIMPLLLGLFGKYLQTKAQQPGLSIKWGVVYLLALGTYAEIPRYTFDFIIKNIGWALFIFIAFDFFVKPSSYKFKKSE